MLCGRDGEYLLYVCVCVSFAALWRPEQVDPAPGNTFDLFGIYT